MKRKKRRKNNIKYSKLLIIASLFLFALMIVRVTQLALSEEIDDTNLQALAKRRTTKTDIIKAERGNIYSSDEEVLAQNVSSYKLIAYLSPSRTTDEDDPQHVVDKEMTAEKLSSVLGCGKDEILKYLNKEGVYQTEFGTIGKGLTEITKSKIEELKLPGIDFIESFKRYYPKGDFASYILGYAKEEITTLDDGSEETNMTGEMGIEKYYDSTLKGEDGYSQTMYICDNGNGLYYFDTYIEDINKEQSYYIEAELTESNNTATETDKTKKVILNNQILGKMTDVTVKIKDSEIIFEKIETTNNNQPITTQPVIEEIETNKNEEEAQRNEINQQQKENISTDTDTIKNSETNEKMVIQ